MAVLPSEMNMKTCTKCHLMMRSLYFKIAKMEKKFQAQVLDFQVVLCSSKISK